jgi:hypothetical protein
MKLKEILVRYNHQAIGNHDRWRFLNGDEETACASVRFLCSSETCQQEVWVDGALISKWHIRPINPSKITQIENEHGIHFIIE